MTSQHSIERQKARVLDRLKAGPVTSCELTRELDILRPASRIFDLRSDGHEIVMHWTYDRINGTDHRVGRYVLMKEQPTDPQKRKSPDPAPHRIEAQQKKQHGHLTKAAREIAGMGVAALIFAASMWSAVFGMTGALDHMEPGMVLAGVASHE